MSDSYDLQFRPVAELKPYANNARTHSKKQINQIAASIKRFGFTNPVLITDEGEVIAGHGRVEAARFLGLTDVPTIVLADLSEAERRAYILADNKLAMNAGWDRGTLAIELQFLTDAAFELDITGFSVAEIDCELDFSRDADATRSEPAPEDASVKLQTQAVSRVGDVWQLGRHFLACGDALDVETYEAVTRGKKMDAIVVDPPYNVRINGHARSSSKGNFREFPMASGEMSADQFEQFLCQSLGRAAEHCRDGAIAYIFMDWRGMGALMHAGNEVFNEMKQLCVWNKGRGGMGSFYRSQHELVFVFKKGSSRHTNTFELGQHGRYRTNVWTYPSPAADSDGRWHPTPKPVALVADAIRDCTKRGDWVIDNFGGSGTTLIAAETCGRNACLIELDPLYCDAIIRRFEGFTGKRAVLAPAGESFEDVAADRLGANAEQRS